MEREMGCMSLLLDVGIEREEEKEDLAAIQPPPPLSKTLLWLVSGAPGIGNLFFEVERGERRRGEEIGFQRM